MKEQYIELSLESHTTPVPTTPKIPEPPIPPLPLAIIHYGHIIYFNCVTVKTPRAQTFASPRTPSVA